MIKGKVHLVKIKDSLSYGATDVLWGLCYGGKDLLTFMGFQGLVKRVNGMGFFAPILSQVSMSWGELIEKVKVHEMGRIGDPVTLFESVHTFKELANFGYDMGILKAEEGQEFLNSLTAVKVSGPPVAFTEALKNAKKNAEMLKVADKGKLSIDMDKIGKQSKEIVNGGGGANNLSQGAKQLIMNGSIGQDGVDDDPIVISDEDILLVPIDEASQENTVEIRSTPAVSGVGGRGAEQVNGAMEEVRSSKDLEIEEIDKIILDLEAGEAGTESLEDCRKRANRYKSLTVTLRRKVEEFKKSNQEFARAAGVHKKQLGEFKVYAADEVIEGLKPTLDPLGGVAKKVGQLQEGLAGMKGEVSEIMKSNTTELHEVSEEVCNTRQRLEEQGNGVLRALTSNGLYERQDSLDIPAAIKEVLRLIRRVAEPSTPVLDDTVHQNDIVGGKGVDQSSEVSAVVQQKENGSLVITQEVGVDGSHQGNGVNDVVGVGNQEDEQHSSLNRVEEQPEIIKKSIFVFGGRKTSVSNEQSLPFSEKNVGYQYSEEVWRQIQAVKNAKILNTGSQGNWQREGSFQEQGAFQNQQFQSFSTGVTLPKVQSSKGLLPTPVEYRDTEFSYQKTRVMMDYRSVAEATPVTYKQQVQDMGAPRKQFTKIIDFVPQSKVHAQLFRGSSSVPATVAYTAAASSAAVSSATASSAPASSAPASAAPASAAPAGNSVIQTVQKRIIRTELGVKLSPKTLQAMGYKRVHGYTVRCEAPKPKRSRWCDN